MKNWKREKWQVGMWIHRYPIQLLNEHLLWMLFIICQGQYCEREICCCYLQIYRSDLHKGFIWANGKASFSQSIILMSALPVDSLMSTNDCWLAFAGAPSPARSFCAITSARTNERADCWRHGLKIAALYLGHVGRAGESNRRSDPSSRLVTVVRRHSSEHFCASMLRRRRQHVHPLVSFFFSFFIQTKSFQTKWHEAICISDRCLFSVFIQVYGFLWHRLDFSQ